MFRLPLPLVGWDLQFHAPLTDTPPWLNLGLFAGIIILLLALMLWLYRYESRLVQPVTARWLLLLRGLVMGCLAALLFFRPVLTRTETEIVPGRVVVALDLSDSMQITDPQRPPQDKLRLAQSLHLADDLCEAEELEAWLQDWQQGRDPLDRLAADSPARRRYTQVLDRVDALSRRDLARALLVPSRSEQKGFLSKLSERHALSVLGFTQQVGELPNEQAQLKLLLEEAPSDRDTPSFTNLRGLMERGLRGTSEQGNNLLGLVLLTDGRHNWGTSPEETAIEYQEKRIPIFPVPLGPRTAPPDIAIESVQAQSNVFKGANATVEARIRLSNMPAGRVRVELAWGDTGGALPRETWTEMFLHDGTDHIYVLRFQPTLNRPGTEILTLSADWDAEQAELPADRHRANNRREFRINVAPDKAKVLLIDGEARWEYHYLEKALARDPIMELQSVVFGQPRLDRIPAAELAKIGYPSLQLPQGEDPLAAYDCIVLGDVSIAQLPPTFRRDLERYVAQRGGTLVILAGKRSMPLRYLDNLRQDASLRLMNNLLPIESAREVRSVEGFPVRLTAEGQRAAFLQMEPNVGASLARWERLPRHYWGVVGKAKQGAVTLAYYDPSGGASELLMGDKRQQLERNHALMVRQNYGFGRVLYVGLDSTWRWRFKTGDKYHHRFWGQVIRWAATDKPLVTGDANIRFGTREPIYRQDQEVEVIVRLGERISNPQRDELVGARLIKLPAAKGEAEEVVARVALQSRPAQPRLLEGSIGDLPPGDYAMEAILPEQADELARLAGPEGDPLKMRARFQVRPPDSAERIDLGTNYPLMNKLAGLTGGEMFHPADADMLLEQLNERTVTRSYPISERLRLTWWPLVLFLGFVTAEWAIRKWAGLA